MMNKILYRTLNLEILLTALVITVVMIVIFLATDIAYQLVFVVSGKLDISTAMSLILFRIPLITIELIPLSMILSVILVLGRMNQDSEFVILLASGVGYKKIYQTVLKMAMLVAFFTGVLTLYTIPIAKQNIKILKNNIGENAVLGSLTAGKFYELSGGNRVIYAEKIDDKILSEVFLQITELGYQHILKADIGRIEKDDNGNQLLSLYNGTRYSYQLNGTDYSVAHYEKNSFLLNKNTKKTILNSIGLMSSVQLLKKLDNHEAQAELQWRLSFPIMLLVIVIIGVGLSKSKPRANKYGKLLPGLLLCALYLNFINIVRYQIINGEINPWIGLWSVHFVFALIAFLLLWRTLKPFKKVW